MANKNGSFVSCDRTANSEDNFLSAEAIEIERVERLIELKADEVGDIDDVVARLQSDPGEPVFEPCPFLCSLPAPLFRLVHGQGMGQVVSVGVQVIHAVGHDDAFVILLVLRLLLHARVKVADDAFALDDRFALEFANDPKYPVGRGMLRPHVHDHRVLTDPFENGLGRRHESWGGHEKVGSWQLAVSGSTG